jgi:hypothetical protein
MKIPSSLRVLLYFTALALLLSGIGWELLDRFVLVSTAIGPGKHPLQPWVLRLHGAVALLSVFLFGFLFSSHIRIAWRLRRKRITGSVLVAVIVILALSGYLLYYAGGDELRAFASALHLWLGVLSPLPFLLHLFYRRRPH